MSSRSMWIWKCNLKGGLRLPGLQATSNFLYGRPGFAVNDLMELTE